MEIYSNYLCISAVGTDFTNPSVIHLSVFTSYPYMERSACYYYKQWNVL